MTERLLISPLANVARCHWNIALQYPSRYARFRAYFGELYESTYFGRRFLFCKGREHNIDNNVTVHSSLRELAAKGLLGVKLALLRGVVLSIGTSPRNAQYHLRWYARHHKTNFFHNCTFYVTSRSWPASL